MNNIDPIALKTAENTAFAVIKDLLVTTISRYTNNPLGQCMPVSPAHGMVIFQIRTEMNDHRKILGRHAHTWHALNVVFRAIGHACGFEIDLRLLKPVGQIEEPLVDRDETDQFDSLPICSTLRALVMALTPAVQGETPEVSVLAQNLAGITAFNILTPVPVADTEVIDALRILVDAFGGKARRKFYLTFQ